MAIMGYGNNNTGYMIGMVIKLCNICENAERWIDRQREGNIEKGIDQERVKETKKKTEPPNH